MSIQLLVDHIRALVAADASLATLNVGDVNYGIPSKLPAIYIDGMTFTDDKQDSHRFNICYVTTDLSIVQFDYAQNILNAIKQSAAIVTLGLLPRPEPEKSRNRWIIPCTYIPAALID
ncbi:hypothetical protein [Sphingobium sp. KCTC 72723]|uniref:hypothetical protein n=1 Tax=Sphingobium sp. KCTC 72723 TaxID=2733867 RepID=UPI00165E8522|nr:hypothetical protein [Sphingobium sp. KCTC 72723]